VLVFFTSRCLLYSQGPYYCSESVDTEMAEALPWCSTLHVPRIVMLQKLMPFGWRITKMGKFCSFCFCTCPVISLGYYNFNSCNCSACNLSLVFECLQEMKVIILSITKTSNFSCILYFCSNDTVILLRLWSINL
jgi:hypothetical protein